MDTSNIISIVLILVAGIVGWFIASSKTPPVVPVIAGEDPLVTEARVKEAQTQAALAEAQVVSGVVLTGAQMAEQLFSGGKIARDERNNAALKYISERLAQLGIKISQDQIVKDLESAVWAVNVGAAYIKAAKAGNAPSPLETINQVAGAVDTLSSTPATGIPNPPTSFKPTGG